MKRNFWLNQLSICLLILGLVITTAAWQISPAKSIHITTDTIPQTKKVKNIDAALEQLEQGRKDIERSLYEKNWNKEMKETLEKVHFDAEKMMQEIDEATKNIDVKKIQEEVTKAIKNVDFEKMKTDLQQNVDKVDLQQMKDEIAKAMKEIDAEKIKADINASISKIDMDKIKLELGKAENIDFMKMEENLKKMKPEIEKSMQGAKESIEKAKKELLEYKGFIDILDKDGLINKSKNYTIEYKNGELSINGKRQSSDVAKKYNSFLKDRKDFTIKKDEDFKVSD